MTTKEIPDPDLMIRTSGEMRLSNFLLWEMAYSELFVADQYWPDFRREQLYEALENYMGRERRFGKTSEQLDSEKEAPDSTPYVRKFIDVVTRKK
jgi:undecaprenyl diphosphate synthase